MPSDDSKKFQADVLGIPAIRELLNRTQALETALHSLAFSLEDVSPPAIERAQGIIKDAYQGARESFPNGSHALLDQREEMALRLVENRQAARDRIESGYRWSLEMRPQDDPAMLARRREGALRNLDRHRASPPPDLEA